MMYYLEMNVIKFSSFKLSFLFIYAIMNFSELAVVEFGGTYLLSNNNKKNY